MVHGISQRYPSLFDNKGIYCENTELESCHLREWVWRSRTPPHEWLKEAPSSKAFLSRERACEPAFLFNDNHDIVSNWGQVLV